MDWKKLISEAMNAGRTQTEIAAYCNCSQGHISDIFNGKVKDPSYSLGKSLEAFHMIAVGGQEKAAA